MVGEFTSYESHSGEDKLAAEEALLGFLDDWNSTADRGERQLALDELVASLMEDGDIDKLTGASGEDWFLGEPDTGLITDLTANGKAKGRKH